MRQSVDPLNGEFNPDMTLELNLASAMQMPYKPVLDEKRNTEDK